MSTSKAETGGQRAIQVIKDMTETVQSLNSASSQLQWQAHAFDSVEFDSEDPLVELQGLQRLLRQHDAEHTERMKDLRQSLQGEIEIGSASIFNEVRGELRSTMKQVIKDEMEAQIQEHIPVPMSRQAEETKEQLRIVNGSLQNSRSRIANASLGVSNLFDPLAVVLTPEGKRSAYWPFDLGSLFAYDLESARALVKDFGLVDSDQLHVNFQRFLTHIGSNIDLFIPDVKD